MTKSSCIALGVIALLTLSGPSGGARAGDIDEANACQTQLADLNASLRGTPMGAVGKPGQSPVKLNNGKWYSISEVDSIRQELHRATKLCRDGKTHDGLNEINLIRRHLDLAALPHPERHGLR